MAKLSNKEKYGDLYEKYSPSLLSILKEILMKKYIYEKEQKSVYRDNATMFPNLVHLPEKELVYLAILDKDDLVLEAIRLDTKTAMLLLEQNKLVPYNPYSQKMVIGEKFEFEDINEKDN